MSYSVEYKILEGAAEKEMLIKAQAGDKEAKDYMILSNIPLVKSVICRYSGRGIEADDLYQVGVMGLMRAIEVYDTNLETKFGTYAYPWIQQFMMRTIQNQGRQIRIPCHLYTKNNQLIMASAKLTQELGRTPTERELAEYAGKTMDEIKEFKTVMLDTCSMSEMTEANESNVEMGNVIHDKSIDVENDIITELRSQEMLKKIRKFTNDKEYKIFCMRAGIGYKECTYEEIAKEFGVTKQRIQQIYRTCMDRLKRNKRIMNFRSA